MGRLHVHRRVSPVRAFEAFQNNGHYLELSKPEYAAVKNYLSLNMEYEEPLTYEEFKEYSPEGAKFFGEVYLRLGQTKSIYIMRKIDREDVNSKFIMDSEALLKAINLAKKESMTIADRIVEDKLHIHYDPYERKHMGFVELDPFEEENSDRACLAIKSRNGYLWSISDMKKTAEEILNFIDGLSDDFIDEYNTKVRKTRENEKQAIVERRERGREQRERQAIPKEGIVVLFQAFPSGRYKFTYSVKSTKERKIELIKQQNGDNASIVHIVETKDTLKFLHQFLKKQYENRHIDDGWYELTEEDIEFFKNEQYPPQAMEWFRG